MANIDNECKDLEVKDFYNESTTHLADIMENQKKMQEQTYGFQFEDMTLREVMNFWHVNTHVKMVLEMQYGNTGKKTSLNTKL